MRAYRNGALEILEKFIEHKLLAIPRGHNRKVDSLAIVVSTFKIPLETSIKYEVDLINRPFVSDNIENWQVFDDDKKIERFLCMQEEFVDVKIDESGAGPEAILPELLNQIGGREILQLKNNCIPKGLVPLEKLFDNNDVAHQPKM